MTGSSRRCSHAPHIGYALYSCGTCNRFALKAHSIEDYFNMAEGEGSNCSECGQERADALTKLYDRQRAFLLRRRQNATTGDDSDTEGARPKIRRELIEESDSDVDSEDELMALWASEDSIGGQALLCLQRSLPSRAQSNSTHSIASSVGPLSPTESPTRSRSPLTPKYIPLSREGDLQAPACSPRRSDTPAIPEYQSSPLASMSAAVVDSPIRRSLTNRKLFVTPASVRSRLAHSPLFPPFPFFPTEDNGSRQSELL